ncbi:hypothetical protein [Cohnella sp. REN36]|uniref:hypothetical protein n=1 Tax=Cohnella sp. REN36 TaxID=2887347 RepID=UPI001D1548E1|nr:hypothetical protein [Cohnella sp. REN36]MCC3371680.1 hypothetical protein [Cohnella sp. REN36]
MTTDNQQPDAQGAATDQDKANELVAALYWNGLQALKVRFDDHEVEGQVLKHDVYGPIFSYQVKSPEGQAYVTGFFLREMLATFQTKQDPSLWISSFFVDLMKSPESVLLPRPPQSEDEAKALIDKQIVPHCAQAVREEFAPEPVHVDLDLHEEHGPVLEAGFPAIREGNNVCAMPLHILMAHFLLNRDPADLLIQGLYRIREEHGLES